MLEWGDPSAPPLVVLHGRGGAAADWSAVAGALADRRHVLVPDQRGHGFSDWDPEGTYLIDLLVDDAAAFIDQLAGGRAAVVGHSMGAVVALVLAARHPDAVARLVLVDGGPLPDGWTPPAPEPAPEDFPSRAAAAAWLVARRGGLGPVPVEEEFPSRFVERPDGTVAWRMDPLLTSRARPRPDPVFLDQWPYVRQLSCPTLVIRGSESALFSPGIAARMAAANPLVDVVAIPGAGHRIHYDRPAELISELKRFLD